MEVTRGNFKETLPLVTESIEKADFLVIDAEFTGLINGRSVSIFDSPQEYYSRLLSGSTEFLLIQYGVCAFYWDEDEKHYMNDAYNFYLFPRGRPGPDKIFLCQSSSLDFLSAQGFDFNKLIKEGISYMTETTESRLRESLIERQKAYEKDVIAIPDEHKQQIEGICERVRQFLDEDKSDELEIDRCNAFIRLLLFQELGARFKDEAFVESKLLENKNRVLKVIRIKSSADGQSPEMQKKEREWEELEDAVGFSKVARMISQSEKLVIGHNMLLDLMHTLNHFFQPLPADYSTFKEFAHCMFPRLLDTKYMSSLPPFKDKVNSSVLQHLLSTLSEPPFALPKTESKAGRGYCRADERPHEAGYDAYVTGLCFLSMQAHLARMRGEPAGRAPPPHSAALKPFVNKLYLAKTAHQDSPYMNIAGDDPTPSRDHVFHLTFPKEWQRNDINHLFSPFGPVTVHFVDDTSALVALARREQARDAARALARHARVTLLPYARYKQPARIPQKDLVDARRDNSAPITSVDKIESTTKAEKVSTTYVSRVQKNEPLPEKVERVRSSSLSLPAAAAAAAPAQPARKRTSSGVFQIDDAEPPPKKTELVRQNSDSPRKTETMSNGRRKTGKGSDKEKGKSGIEKVKEDSKVIEKGTAGGKVIEQGDSKGDKVIEKGREGGKVIEIFDSEAKTRCVPVFKESDSWD